MSQNYETCYSTLSNMRAYRQECDNSFDYFIYFSLSSQHISLSVCNTALSLSLSPFWSSSLCCFLFLSHFHFFYLSLSSSLSTFRYYRRKSDPSQHLFLFFFFFFLSLSLSLSFPITKKKAIPIWSKARWLKLANLNLCSLIKTSARPKAVADLCSSYSTVADLCSSSSTALAADILLFYFVEVFGFGICRRIWWLGL